MDAVREEPRPGLTHVEVLTGYDRDTLPFADLIAQGRPFVLKGLVRDWPFVTAGGQGAAAAIDYLKQFDGGRPVVGYTGAPEMRGRYFYNAEVSGMNFAAARVGLSDYLDRIEAHADDPAAPYFYIGSTDLDAYLPGLAEENRPPMPPRAEGQAAPLVSIWMGNRTIASAHFDMSNNLALNAVGRRRFTLFPPDQVANLYPGPIEPTPGGQVVSMVDFDAPDLARHPRFAEALAAAQVAELEPGDGLIYPALWWHQVEALDPFNAMVNVWWNAAPAFLDSPWTTILHGMLSLRDRPAQEKAAWRAMFDHYLFDDPAAAADHLPPAARGPLAPLDANMARRLRALLLQKLNR